MTNFVKATSVDPAIRTSVILALEATEPPMMEQVEPVIEVAP